VPSSAVGALGSGAAYAEFFGQVETLGLDAVWTEDRIFHCRAVEPRHDKGDSDGDQGR
jgi:hypothetical protein